MARKKTEIPNILYDDIRDRYYVSLYYGLDEFGKKVQKFKSCKTKTEAKKLLKEFESNKTRKELATPNDITLAEWLSYWYNNVVIMNNEITTQEEYHTIIYKHIIPKLGNISLQKLTADNIQAYYTQKQTEPNGYKKNKQPYPPLSSNTVKKHHTLLKTSLGLAKKQKKIVFNPILDVVPPKYVKPETLYYNLEKLINLFQIIYDTNLEPAIYLAGTIGLRREEISGLKWDKVNMEKRNITIANVDVRAFNKIQTKNTKNDTSTRLIAMPNELYEVLQRHKEKQLKDKELLGDAYNPIDIELNYVVVNDLGYQINPATLSSSIMKLVKKHDLPHIHLRGLRHTVASVLNASGVTLYDISKLLGHSSPDVTGKIYTHTFQRDNQQTIDIMSNALSNAKKE